MCDLAYVGYKYWLATQINDHNHMIVAVDRNYRGGNLLVSNYKLGQRHKLGWAETLLAPPELEQHKVRRLRGCSLSSQSCNSGCQRAD